MGQPPFSITFTVQKRFFHHWKITGLKNSTYINPHSIFNLLILIIYISLFTLDLLLQNPKNYGSIKNLDNIKNAIFTKQMESLQKIMLSMTKTLEELNSVVMSLAKTYRDAKQQVKGGSIQPSMKQLHQRIGVKPSIADCLEGLRILHEMYQSEYLVKSSVTSALASLALNPSVGDLQALERVLVDQPNIPKEVKSIYDVIFAEEIC